MPSLPAREALLALLEVGRDRAGRARAAVPHRSSFRLLPGHCSANMMVTIRPSSASLPSKAGRSS
jgi:hypothetical protein